jgi:WD40 repeat protein
MAETIDNNNPIYCIENYCFGEVRGNELYCWGENQPIIIVDIMTGNIIREISIKSRLKADDFRYLGGGCGYGGMNVQIDPKGRYILIHNNSLSPTYSLYDLVRNDWLTSQYLNYGGGHIGSNPFSPDGKLIGCHISTDWDENKITFGIYNIESGEEINRVKGLFDPHVKDDYTEGDEHFYNISENDSICVFGFDFDPDFNFHILYKKYADECYSIIMNAFFCKKSNNEEYCIVEGAYSPHAYNRPGRSDIVLHRKKILGSLSLDTTMNDHLQFVAVFSNTEKYLATVQTNKDVEIHQLPSLAIVKRLSAHKKKESNINLIGFSPDDRLLIYSDGINIISVDIGLIK